MKTGRREKGGGDLEDLPLLSAVNRLEDPVDGSLQRECQEKRKGALTKETERRSILLQTSRVDGLKRQWIQTMA